jgi:hypothetical protein
MTAPRIISPKEIRELLFHVTPGTSTIHLTPETIIDLAHTAAVLGDIVDAVKKLAEPYLGQADSYQHYAIQIGDQVHLAVMLDDLRKALSSLPQEGQTHE